MHVLIFLWYRASHGGLHDSVADAAASLLTQGHKITLVCSPGPFVQRMTALGATVHTTDYQDWDAFLASGALNETYDLVHAYQGPSHIWGLQAGERLGVPLFITIHNAGIDQVEDWWQQCEGIFAVSPAVREKILREVPQAAERVHYMPHVVGALPPAMLTGSLPGTTLQVLVASCFDEYNVLIVETLLEIWKAQAERGETSVRWEIAGTGTEEARLREGAEALDRVAGQAMVRFHGWLNREALAALEAKCQVALSSGHSASASLARGMPTVALASAGCFGLVTRENYWQSVWCNFGDFGLDEAVPASGALDVLREFAASDQEALRRAVDCSDLTRSYFSSELWTARLLSHYARATGKSPKVPFSTPFMPDAEIEHLTRAYAEANVILEYGSGGSTEIAARMPGKYIMSVESDLAWARALRGKLSGLDILSRAVIHHVDIGDTGPWGRPLDDHAWRDFHAYPNDVWDRAWFRHPDVVLIDGRFRTACLAAVLLRAQRPVRVLFDDYGVRPLYHQVEEVIKPVRMVGRMAEFHVEPDLAKKHDIGLLIRQFFQVSLHGMSEKDYQVSRPARSG